ncbi:MAG: ribonuclease P protein component [Flammeovirgaceae bacterium]|nr:MAG: ribonuclease P protein component [Flammeovirgaceae bacterium]
MSAYRLPKSGRLRGQKKIQELFKRGSSFYLQPFRVVFLKTTGTEAGHQVLFSVSKRDFKKATSRNRIKRLMKEAYRLNQNHISSLPELQIAYIYTAKEWPDFSLIQEKLIESFGRLKQYVEKS